MSRRIIGQCNAADFVDLEHMAMDFKDSKILESPALKPKQKFAFLFLVMAKDNRISWDLLTKVVQEALFWGESEDKVTYIEIKFFLDKTKINDIQAFMRLWKY